MTRRKAVAQKEPTFAPERALVALRRQLENLRKLNNREYQEAETDEIEWKNFTQNIVEGAFGNPSTPMQQFYAAREAGSHHMTDTREQQLRLNQDNFESRIKAYEALLRSLIETLKLQLPEEEIQGVYNPGDEYDFYRDLSSLVEAATNEILIVDAYLDEEVFNLYVSKVSDATTVRILSNQIGPNVETVAKKYAKSQSLELRSSKRIHDRMVFLDQRSWVIGQSIKDAAKTKPTYLVELTEPLLAVARDAHEKIWEQARVIELGDYTLTTCKKSSIGTL